MSEEKEAIKHLNKRYKFMSENPLATNMFTTLDVHNLGTILNYIDKLEKEVEEKQTIIYLGAKKVNQLQKENDNNYLNFIKEKNKADKLQKEIEELKKELEIFNGIKKGTTIMFGAKTQYWRKDKIEKYFISKDKIRNEIKELENILEKRKTIDIIEEINRLEELLKEE